MSRQYALAPVRVRRKRRCRYAVTCTSFSARWMPPGDDRAAVRPRHRECCAVRLCRVAAPDIDSYLAGLDEAKRGALQQLRQCILGFVPHADECIAYGMPAFKVRGKTVAGFAAFKDHLSYLPHSGSVLSTIADDLAGYEVTKGSLHFEVDEPLPTSLVEKLIETRMRELDLHWPQP